MAKGKNDRFQRIMQLTPRRFHVPRDPAFAPPYDQNFFLCGHVNEDEEDGSPFSLQREGIKNCKPGIWTSRKLPLSEESREANPLFDEDGFEALLYWVADGEININQSVEDWEEYEAATRASDAAVELKDLFPSGAAWSPCGTYFDDGAICTVISAEYLSRNAANDIFGHEDFDIGYYFETLTLNGSSDGEMDENGKYSSFTLGGMNFNQDEVGFPPQVSILEHDGKVIAIKVYAGETADDEATD